MPSIKASKGEFEIAIGYWQDDNKTSYVVTEHKTVKGYKVDHIGIFKKTWSGVWVVCHLANGFSICESRGKFKLFKQAVLFADACSQVLEDKKDVRYKGEQVSKLKKYQDYIIKGGEKGFSRWKKYLK